MVKFTSNDLLANFRTLGVSLGDTLLIRASLGAVGRIDGGTHCVISCLIEAVGQEGTIVSLAFTDSTFLKRARKKDAFHISKKSYAGALPNSMLNWPNAKRSSHPMCSFVAIGKNAEFITSGHDEHASAYEPVRKIIELRGKCILVGCVKNSPGFTTTHLAETDLGYLNSLPVLPRLRTVYFEADDGELKLFRRKDPGLCSDSFFKFYSLYVREGVLNTGFIGNAFSILAPAKKCYEIDLETLRKDKKFNLCNSNNCWTCNVGRWDIIHRAPAYFLRKMVKFIVNKFNW